MATWLHEHFGFPIVLALGAVYTIEFMLFFCLAGWILPKIRWPRMRNRHSSDLSTALLCTFGSWLLLMSFFTVCESMERRARIAWETEQAETEP